MSCWLPCRSSRASREPVRSPSRRLSARASQDSPPRLVQPVWDRTQPGSPSRKSRASRGTADEAGSPSRRCGQDMCPRCMGHARHALRVRARCMPMLRGRRRVRPKGACPSGLRASQKPTDVSGAKPEAGAAGSPGSCRRRSLHQQQQHLLGAARTRRARPGSSGPAKIRSSIQQQSRSPPKTLQAGIWRPCARCPVAHAAQGCLRATQGPLCSRGTLSKAGRSMAWQSRSCCPAFWCCLLVCLTQPWAAGRTCHEVCMCAGVCPGATQGSSVQPRLFHAYSPVYTAPCSSGPYVSRADQVSSHAREVPSIIVSIK